MVTLEYKKEGTGVAGHFQPRISFWWEYSQYGAIANRDGYDADYPCPLSDHVSHFLNQPEYKSLDAFYQSQETWAWGYGGEGRQSGLPPEHGTGYFMFEFWTRNYAGVRACLAALTEDLKAHGVPLTVVET